jgi:hypothetical protein
MVYKDLHPSPVNEHESKEPKTSVVYGIDRDHSLETLGVKQETVDADYDIDNIFNDLNAIFDATIFDRVDQEEEDPLESTFVIEQEHDVEQLLAEDPTEQIDVDMAESDVVNDNQVEVRSMNCTDHRTAHFSCFWLPEDRLAYS